MGQKKDLFLPPLISSRLRAYKLDAERDVNERPSGRGWTGRAPFGIRHLEQRVALLQAWPCRRRTPTGNCEQGADSSTSVRRACGARILCQVAARPQGGGLRGDPEVQDLVRAPWISPAVSARAGVGKGRAADTLSNFTLSNSRSMEAVWLTPPSCGAASPRRRRPRSPTQLLLHGRSRRHEC